MLKNLLMQRYKIIIRWLIKNDTIRLHHVTTKEGMFYSSETWSMKNRITQKM